VRATASKVAELLKEIREKKGEGEEACRGRTNCLLPQWSGEIYVALAMLCCGFPDVEDCVECSRDRELSEVRRGGSE